MHGTKEKYLSLEDCIKKEAKIVEGLKGKYPISNDLERDILNDFIRNLKNLEIRARRVHDRLKEDHLYKADLTKIETFKKEFRREIQDNLEKLMSFIREDDFELVYADEKKLNEDQKSAENMIKETPGNKELHRILKKYVLGVRKIKELNTVMEHSENSLKLIDGYKEKFGEEISEYLIDELGYAYGSLISWRDKEFQKLAKSEQKKISKSLKKVKGGWKRENKLFNASRGLQSASLFSFAAGLSKYLNIPALESIRDTLTSIPGIEDLIDKLPIPLAWIAAAAFAGASVFSYANYQNIKQKRKELKPKYWIEKGKELYETSVESEDLKRAITYLDEAIYLNPDIVDAWNLKGLIYDKLGDENEAIKNFSIAVKLKPGSTILSNKASVLCKIGRLEDALTEVDKALAKNSKDDYAHFTKGEVLSKLKQLDKAQEFYEKSLEIKPDGKFALNAYLAKADILVRKGELKKAEKNYQVVVNNAPFFSNIAETAIKKLKNTVKARELIEEADHIANKSKEKISLRSLKVEKYYLKAYERTPKNLKLIEKISKLAGELGDFEKSIGYLELALDVYPEKYSDDLEKALNIGEKEKNEFRGGNILTRLFQEAGKHFTPKLEEKDYDPNKTLASRPYKLKIWDPFKGDVSLTLELDGDKIKYYTTRHVSYNEEKPLKPKYHIPKKAKGSIELNKFVENLYDESEHKSFFDTLKDEVGLEHHWHYKLRNLFSSEPKTTKTSSFAYAKPAKTSSSRTAPTRSHADKVAEAKLIEKTLDEHHAKKRKDYEEYKRKSGLDSDSEPKYKLKKKKAKPIVKKVSKKDDDIDRELQDILDRLEDKPKSESPAEAHAEAKAESVPPLFETLTPLESKSKKVKRDDDEITLLFKRVGERISYYNPKIANIDHDYVKGLDFHGLFNYVVKLNGNPHDDGRAAAEVLYIISNKKPKTAEEFHEKAKVVALIANCKNTIHCLNKKIEHGSLAAQRMNPNYFTGKKAQELANKSKEFKQDYEPVVDVDSYLPTKFENEMYERYQQRADTWKEQGYDTSSLKDLVDSRTDLKIIKKEFDIVRRKIYKAKDLEVELLSYNRKGVDQEVNLIRQDIKDLNKIDALQKYHEELTGYLDGKNECPEYPFLGLPDHVEIVAPYSLPDHVEIAEPKSHRTNGEVSKE